MLGESSLPTSNESSFIARGDTKNISIKTLAVLSPNTGRQTIHGLWGTTNQCQQVMTGLHQKKIMLCRGDVYLADIHILRCANGGRVFIPKISIC